MHIQVNMTVFPKSMFFALNLHPASDVGLIFFLMMNNYPSGAQHH
jgi:hypothetical protein